MKYKKHIFIFKFKLKNYSTILKYLLKILQIIFVNYIIKVIIFFALIIFKFLFGISNHLKIKIFFTDVKLLQS